MHTIATRVVLLNILLEHLDCNQIKDWDHIGWIVLKLLVKTLVELEDMTTVNIKSIFFSLSNLFQKRDIMRFLIHVLILDIFIKISIRIINDGESSQELSKSLLEIISVDVGSPKNLGIARHFSVSSKHVAH